MIGLNSVLHSAQLAASILLAGSYIFLLAVARPAFLIAKGDGAAAFGRFDARVLSIAWWSLLALLLAGLLSLWGQLAAVTGVPWWQALTAERMWSLLSGTQYGRVWLLRLSLMVLLAGILWLYGQERDSKDWWALRGEVAGLALSILLAQAWMGHSATGEGFDLVYQVLVDALHLLTSAVWLGSLPLLAVLLCWMQRSDDPTAGEVAAEATRRFSTIALASMSLLILSGLANAWTLVGTFPALIGTPYGRWLLLKVSLMLPLLGFAALNLVRDKPRVIQGVATPEQVDVRSLLQRLRRNVLGESLCGGAILLVVGALSVLPPAVHEQPYWPFASRLSWEATIDLPGVRRGVALGIQVSILGFFVALLSVITRLRYWLWFCVAGIVAVGVGFWLWLPKLTIDAYPTTYVRSSVPYNTLSIAHGLQLYSDHCTVCHGTEGYGDGPAAAALRPRPADLTAAHTAHHTAGDLFWWLTRGMTGRAMPAFQDHLSEEERWDLVNVVRMLSAAEQARALGPTIAGDLRIVAPDFSYQTQLGEMRTLKDFRGQTQVLLVFFTLADSGGRLAELRDLYPKVRTLGTEILAIPLQENDSLDDVVRRMRIPFPVIMDGWREVSETYDLFGRSLNPETSPGDAPTQHHMELLVDRQGYLRGRWLPREGIGWAKKQSLEGALEQLQREKLDAPLPDLHVH